jgi:branched-chain amino acid transport system substrate-binding protein
VALTNRSARCRLCLALVAVVVVTVLSGCGSSGASSSSSGSPGSSNPGASSSTTSGGGASVASSCGPKPGQKATGTPINIGAIDTKEPGLDFSDGPNMVSAYFACVNDNGGVSGHPLKLFVQYDQSQPTQIEAAAKKLIQSDHVVGIVGVFDLLECTIDQGDWKQLGIFEIDAGIAPSCWSSPNSAAVNMGPRFSSDGAVQYGLSHGASKMVFANGNVPGAGYDNAGVQAVAGAAHVPLTVVPVDLPVTDADSLAIKLVDAAGSNGWVVLDFTPPEALVILQAAQKLGLADRVKGWGCSTPCDTDFLAKALGPKWNHKLFVNAELTDPDDHNGPEIQLYKAILAHYGASVSGGVGSFSEMGFVMAKFAVNALQKISGPYTIKTVNAALKGIKDAKSELLCQPWVYGKYPMHVPNNADFMTTPDNGKLVTIQGCTAVPSSDPQLAAYRRLAGTAPSTNPPTK